MLVNIQCLDKDNNFHKVHTVKMAKEDVEDKIQNEEDSTCEWTGLSTVEHWCKLKKREL